MAHIPLSYTPPEYGGKRFIYSVPEGGMKLCDREELFDKYDTCAFLSNLETKGSYFSSRNGQKSVCMMPKGQVHNFTKEPFFEHFIIHIGSDLCSFDAKGGTYNVISADFPDKKSLFCQFMSKLYIYCDSRVFSLDDMLVLKEEDADAALLYSGVSPAAGSSAKRIQGSCCNLVSPRIRVEYDTSANAVFYVPVKINTDRKTVLYDGENVVDESEYDVYENRITYGSGGDTKQRQISIEYYVKDPERIGYTDELYNFTVCESFGGDINGGTRVFFSGNEAFKGRYRKSALQNPLYVAEDEYETFGDGCENVTAMKKMYGDLIVFTERSVFKMTYALLSDGPFFSVKRISTLTGCDCPYSVQLIDNKVVFANSQKGVFIVSSVEETGETNIKPISGNINKGDMGFLACESAVKTAAYSLDFDRKYMLFVGENAYIWDYDSTSFVDTGNYLASQNRLKWYMYTGVKGDIFFVVDRKVHSLTKNDSEVFCFSEDAPCESECVFDTGSLAFGNAFGKKLLSGVEFLLKKKTPGDITISVYCDEAEYFTKSMDFTAKSKTKTRISLPIRHGYSYGVRLSSNVPFDFFGAAFTYKFLK